MFGPFLHALPGPLVFIEAGSEASSGEARSWAAGGPMSHLASGPAVKSTSQVGRAGEAPLGYWVPKLVLVVIPRCGCY